MLDEPSRSKPARREGRRVPPSAVTAGKRPQSPGSPDHETAPGATETPGNRMDSDARIAQLKIMVSPVRVRVSPSHERPGNRVPFLARQPAPAVAATRHHLAQSPKRKSQTRSQRGPPSPIARRFACRRAGANAMHSSTPPLRSPGVVRHLDIREADATASETIEPERSAEYMRKEHSGTPAHGPLSCMDASTPALQGRGSSCQAEATARERLRRTATQVSSRKGRVTNTCFSSRGRW
jgi:hypothetical protein